MFAGFSGLYSQLRLASETIRVQQENPERYVTLGMVQEEHSGNLEFGLISEEQEAHNILGLEPTNVIDTTIDNDTTEPAIAGETNFGEVLKKLAPIIILFVVLFLLGLKGE